MGGAFDFLLHYLTAKGGIPQSIQKLTPGMGPQNLVSTTNEGLARALEGLGAILRRETRRMLDASRRSHAVVLGLGVSVVVLHQSR